MNIESLVRDRDEINERIETFYNKEVFQYLNYKKEKPWSTFELIYKRIGKNFYHSPEIIQELKKRFEKCLDELNRQKKLEKALKKKFTPKEKVIPTRERVFQLLDQDITLTPKQVSRVLNISISAADYHVRKKRMIEEAKKSWPVEKQIAHELTPEQGCKCFYYLSSILRNF